MALNSLFCADVPLSNYSLTGRKLAMSDMSSRDFLSNGDTMACFWLSGNGPLFSEMLTKCVTHGVRRSTYSQIKKVSHGYNEHDLNRRRHDYMTYLCVRGRMKWRQWRQCCISDDWRRCGGSVSSDLVDFAAEKWGETVSWVVIRSIDISICTQHRIKGLPQVRWWTSVLCYAVHPVHLILIEVTRGPILTHSDSTHAQWRKDVPFLVHTIADNI